MKVLVWICLLWILTGSVMYGQKPDSIVVSNNIPIVEMLPFFKSTEKCHYRLFYSHGELIKVTGKMYNHQQGETTLIRIQKNIFALQGYSPTRYKGQSYIDTLFVYDSLLFVKQYIYDSNNKSLELIVINQYEWKSDTVKYDRYHIRAGSTNFNTEMDLLSFSEIWEKLGIKHTLHEIYYLDNEGYLVWKDLNSTDTTLVRFGKYPLSFCYFPQLK